MKPREKPQERMGQYYENLWEKMKQNYLHKATEGEEMVFDMGSNREVRQFLSKMSWEKLSAREKIGEYCASF